MKSDTSAGDTPNFYTSDESEKRDQSRRFTSSDIDCFKVERNKKKKVFRKRRRKIKDINSSLETVQQKSSGLETVKEETITAKLLPTVSGNDVKSILNTVNCDTCNDINVNVTVISIGSSESEDKQDNGALNLTTVVKKEIDSSPCSSTQLYSEVPTYSQVQTEDCQSEYMLSL